MSYAYDELARIKERTLNLTSPFKSSVNYLSGASPNTTTAMVERLQNGNDILSYTYDDLGNIETISENGELKVTYTYDELSQLVREDNLYQNQTITYTYDTGGNILSVSEYAYTTGELGEVVAVKTYGYEDANWKDKLTSYNGQTITYDEIGNPLQYRDGMNFTWQNGRQLASINDNITYQYNDGGIRTQKTVNGVTTNYYLNGSTILSQVTGSDQMDFYYDDTGNSIGFSLNGASYYYVKNLQNDIIGILDSNGNKVVSYVYDSWGSLISTTGSLAETVGIQNPLRYRGYYYDVESEMYYLNSRYYDPEIGRFINADGLVGSVGSLQKNNLYAYCKNNPITLYDPAGAAWGTIDSNPWGFSSSSTSSNTIAPPLPGWSIADKEFVGPMPLPNWTPSTPAKPKYKNLNAEQKKFVAVIAGEAIGANARTQKAVGHTIMNRVNEPRDIWVHVKSVSDVLIPSQYNAVGLPQYNQCMSYLDSRDGKNDEYESLIAAVMPVYYGEEPDFTGGAHYIFNVSGSADLLDQLKKQPKRYVKCAPVDGISDTEYQMYRCMW